MEVDSIKVIYHQFTGRYTDGPDFQPIFQDYPGYVVGPFKATKPPKFEHIPGQKEPKVIHRGEVDYLPNNFEIMIPMGNGYKNLPREGWHLEVNQGTEYYPKYARIENAMEKKYVRNTEMSWFEFVDGHPLSGAGAVMATTTDAKRLTVKK